MQIINFLKNKTKLHRSEVPGEVPDLMIYTKDQIFKELQI